MNCGITLGIRCPECRAVMPVGAKTCTGCGHSFVKKKKLFSFPLWDWMKKNAKPLVSGLVLLLLVFTLVAASFPGMALTVLLEDTPLLEYVASGYSLMGYFIGGHPEGITTLLELRELADDLSYKGLAAEVAVLERFSGPVIGAGTVVDRYIICGTVGESNDDGIFFRVAAEFVPVGIPAIGDSTGIPVNRQHRAVGQNRLFRPLCGSTACQ
jgi:hypothetical protein